MKDFEQICLSNRILSNINRFAEYGNICYAMKANSSEPVIKAVSRKTSNFSISNIRHYNILNKLKVDSINMCVINVLLSNDELMCLYKNGVRFFTFDNFESLKVFINSIDDYTNLKISLRLNIAEVFNKEKVPFGATSNEIYKMMSFLKSKNIKYGLSFYIQSEFKKNKNALIAILSYIKRNFKDYQFTSISGICFLSNEEKAFIKRYKYICKEIIFDLGTAIVNDAIIIKTPILRKIELPGKDIVIIKNGIYGGFFDILLCNRKYDFYIKNTKLQYERLRNHRRIDIYGGSCDSRDFIGTFYVPKGLKIKGSILIKNAGAYFIDFLMAYQPIEVKNNSF